MSNNTIFPSAGHHNADPGAMANGRREADETKIFRDGLAAELQKLGAKFITDKDWETNGQYQGRIKTGNGSVVFDIHFNSASDPKATGTEVFVKRNADGTARKLAEEIVQFASATMGIKNRGVKEENQSQHNTIGILHKEGQAVLWEICFISNPADMAAYDRCRTMLQKGMAAILKKADDLIP